MSMLNRYTPETDLTLDMCCGGKKCPVNKILADGSLQVTESRTGATVTYSPEQREQLRAWLDAHKSA